MNRPKEWEAGCAKALCPPGGPEAAASGGADGGRCQEAGMAAELHSQAQLQGRPPECGMPAAVR